MGQFISAVRSAINEVDAEAERKAKQDLDILQKILDTQLDIFENQLNEKFLNPAATAKTEVPGIRALRKVRSATVKTSTQPSRTVDSAIEDFFSIGNSDRKTEAAVKDGFKKVVTTALDIFIGNTEIGQHEERKYFIYMMHNAVVRLDVLLWRWNFAGNGFSDKYEYALGYVICTSIVDVAVLKTSEFVFLISEYAGDSQDQVTKYCDALEQIYNSTRKVKLSQGVSERKAILPPDDDTRVD